MQRSFLMAMGFGMVFAAGAFAFNPDELDRIRFDNVTGTKIDAIFLSPGDSGRWGPDIIGADFFLQDGESIGCYVQRPDPSFRFDIMALDDKGNMFEVRGFQMTRGRDARVRLTPGSLDRRARALTFVTVRIANNTGNEIPYLFVSPRDSKAWGADLLDEETTLADGSAHAFLLAVGKDKMKYDLMAVDRDNNEYQFGMTIDPRAKGELTWAIEPGDLKKAPAPGRR